MVIFGCLGGVALIWLMLQPQPVAVDLAQVKRGAMMLVVREDGRTRVREKYIVSAPLSGRLVRVDLDPGDPVVATETQVALIQPTDPDLLDPRALAEAQSRLKSAEVRLSQMEPRVQLAKDKLNFAETELGRIRQLTSKNASTRSDVDAAELAFDTARAEHADAVFAQEISEFELQLAKAALIHTNGSAEQGEKAYQLPIQSPISGRVLRVFQESATVVTAGTPLLEIGDPGDLEVEVDVLSADAVRIHPGAKVFLEQWGGDQPVEGKVRLVEPSAFTKVSALGIEEQRVNVIIDFDASAESASLGDGYRVDARIVIWEGQNILKVPVGALFRWGSDWAVFVNHTDRAVKTSVAIGHRNDSDAEVLDGLTEGEEVVVHPGDQLQEGMTLQRREP